jgi:hypothetical protein
MAEATPANPTNLRRIFAVLGGMLMWPIFFVLFTGAPACMGFEDPTLRTLEACPDVATALGTPIRRSWLGMSCGNAETSGAFGRASWTFPVAGPNGSGSVSVVAEQRGGPWVLYRADVEVAGRTIDALRCAGGGAGLPGTAAITRHHLVATITSAVGNAPAAVGSTCEIDVGPGDGPFNCRAIVTCGGNVVYGAGTTGYSNCLVDPTGQVTFTDAETSPTSGDPVLTLPIGAGSGTMTDTTPAGTWVVTFTFPPG